MIPDWETNCVYFSGLLAKRHRALCSRMTKILQDHGVRVGLLEGTRDVWARDYCPVQVTRSNFIKFRYHPDYLKDYENLITGDTVCDQLTALGKIRRAELVLDGGNVVGTRKKVILTEKVYRENRNWNRTDLKNRLKKLLGVGNCIIIPEEPGDVISHSDGIVRFLKEGLMVISDHSKVDRAYGKRLRSVLEKQGLQVDILPYLPENRSTGGIPSAVGNYVNFLRVGSLVLLPAYGIPEDEKARGAINRLLPEATVVPVRCKPLARQGGVLNCVGWPVMESKPMIE